MQEPDGCSRLAAYLARELGTGYRVIDPEMPEADNPTVNPGGIGLNRCSR